MEELASCTSATERYDAFNAVRNRFGGDKMEHESQQKTVSVARRPSRKSDSLSVVKPPIALVQGESESASEEAQERIAKAKEMAVSSVDCMVQQHCVRRCMLRPFDLDYIPPTRTASRLPALARLQCGNGAQGLRSVVFPLILGPPGSDRAAKAEKRASNNNARKVRACVRACVGVCVFLCVHLHTCVLHVPRSL